MRKEVLLSSRRKKELNAAAIERAKAAHERAKQAIRDAGGRPPEDVDAELRLIRHERLVHDEEELRAFQTEELAFFSSQYGTLFRDGVTECPGDLKTIGFPALVSVRAYRSNWAQWDIEPADDLVVDYRPEYPDGFVRKPPPDMSAHEAALRTYTSQFRSTKFDDVESLAFKLIQYCLEKNLVGFAALVQKEMKRRLPDVADAAIQAAYERENEEWIEAYCSAGG